MHRRPLGRGRSLAAVGAVIILVGCVLPWWELTRPGGLPPIGGNAFEGSGILVFFAGLATLALLALPYAVGDRPTGIDRPLAYAILAGIGWLGFAWRVIDLLLAGAFRFAEPAQAFTNGPGLWIAALGLAVLSRAVFQMTREPAYR
ncbi:MAG TPA: hypothetical protein VD763_11415 [Candidatus Saccharimonadales bacterium]|nr:hypothetical protein [Candidatus Saccharimonadales bacterium]